jgi:hypothetical protein
MVENWKKTGQPRFGTYKATKGVLYKVIILFYARKGQPGKPESFVGYQSEEEARNDAIYARYFMERVPQWKNHWISIGNRRENGIGLDAHLVEAAELFNNQCQKIRKPQSSDIVYANRVLNSFEKTTLTAINKKRRLNNDPRFTIWQFKSKLSESAMYGNDEKARFIR